MRRRRVAIKNPSAILKQSSRNHATDDTNSITRTENAPNFLATKASQITRQSGTLGNSKSSPSYERLCMRGGISMVSGEHILEQVDFELPGPLSLAWRRTYRSSHHQDFGLGCGWSAPYFARLSIHDGKALYTDSEGRLITFPCPSIGDGCHNPVEQLTLFRDTDAQIRIINQDGMTLLFKGRGDTKRLYALSNNSGQHIQFYYTESGRLTHVIDSTGRLLKLEYTVTHRLSSVSILDNQSKPLGKPLVQYRYSNQGDLISVVDAAGNAQQFTYRNHVITQHRTKDGFNFYFQWDRYDCLGKCTRHWSESHGYDYHFEYDEANETTSYTSGAGNTTIFHYNKLGLIRKETDPEGGDQEFEYDDHGRLLLQRDPMGNTTRYGYDTNGRLTRIVNSLGHTTRLAYDDTGRLNSAIDAMGLRWRRHYDTHGRLTSETDPQGHAVQYRYDQQGNLILITDAMKRSHRLDWNNQGELLCKSDPAGSREEYRYDHLGRITEVHKQNQITQYDYDPMGRIIRITHPDLSEILLEYSPQGRLTRHVDALGRTTQYRYDGLGQLIERINAHGQSFKYEYDGDGNLTALINENGECYSLLYDKNQRLIKEVGFDGRVQHYGYDAAGHLVSHTDGDNRITQFKRDALGQLLKKWSSDQDISRYEYDPLGRLSRAVNHHAELEFKYSDNGRLVEERQNNVRLRHEYDLNKQRSATLINNQRIDYEYNGQGLFKRIAYNGSTITSVTRNAHGQEIARTSGAISSFFAYDAMGHLIRQRATHDHTSILERNYQYDKAGNLRQIDDLKFGTILFKYDALDRLQAVEGLTPERFSFDPAGNLLDVREAFAGNYVKGNRLTLFQDYRFDYDKAGNLVGETKGKKQSRHFYNTQNQLIKTEKDDRTIHYAYDPLGRRITKQSDDNTTTYIWDGDVLLREQCTRRKITYIHEPGNDNPLCQIRDGKVYYYHNDQFGTPQCITDSLGNVVWEARYKAYGAVDCNDTQVIDNNIRFQGQYFDEETGLYCHRNRYFHPTIARFIHQDPIGLTGGENSYQYAPNSLEWADSLRFSPIKANHRDISVCAPLTGPLTAPRTARQTAVAKVCGPTAKQYGKVTTAFNEPLDNRDIIASNINADASQQL
ncbi:MAG: DUF6531 domain-containing protein [Gammaproteobacteria bacterium]|nr:DUF6531 domain-containing protein [Gammaproteobacteria bacterium]